MSKWGKADFRQLVELQKRVDGTLSQDVAIFMKQCAKALTARLLALVIKRTPVNKDPNIVGGTLRRGWTGGVQRDSNAYVNSLAVNKRGNHYEVVITNPVNYARYVEFGHRTRNGGFTKGTFMLTVSEKELKQRIPQITEQMILEFLRGVFDAK